MRRRLGLVALAAVAAAVLGLPTPAPAVTDLVTWQVAPGVVYSEWSQHLPQGREVVHELDIDPGEPGVALDYATNDVLRHRRTVRQMVGDRAHAVAGTNGTYFDIDDVGAPLGLGSDVRHGLLHAESTAWGNTFWEARGGRFHVGPLSFVAHIVAHPRWQVTNLNSPHLAAQGIGVYTRRFGTTVGLRVVDGGHGAVREVVVRRGVVRSNTPALSHGGTIHGVLLVGRGQGADDLASLEVGEPLDVTWRLRERPQLAMSGGEILLQDGVVTAHSDRTVAPRTAIGIDRDTGHLLLVVVDGRSRESRGLTLRGLAHLMSRLGAENALDLDGGASSTMVARRRNGLLGVLNTPSAGHPRKVPDALEVTYGGRKPSGLTQQVGLGTFEVLGHERRQVNSIGVDGHRGDSFSRTSQDLLKDHAAAVLVSGRHAHRGPVVHHVPGLNLRGSPFVQFGPRPQAAGRDRAGGRLNVEHQYGPKVAIAQTKSLM